MIILGIESTAHTFGAAIVKNDKILSNVKSSYTTEKSGIIPMEAARHHRENKDTIYSEAIEKSNIKEKDIDAIAISQGPGLAPCLLEGMKFAKELALKLKIPIVPVNHCVAHLEIGRITGAKDPVMLYASGANTQIIAYASGKFRVFGETLDIGIGNFIDTFARYAGIGFPGGPRIETMASEGKTLIQLPYKVKGMDISLSGILTNLRQKLEMIGLNNLPHNSTKKNFNKKNNITDFTIDNNHKKIQALTGTNLNYTLQDLAFSLQETAFSMLVEVSERALAHTGKKELLLGGGVACNKRLQEMCKIMCEERGVKCFIPTKDLLTDNPAMIAFLGEIMFNSGIRIDEKEIGKLDIKPRQRTDDVEVNWRKN